jgi:FtsK/SpoIIIE family
MAKAHKLLAAGTATIIAEPMLALAHQGGLGIIVGLAIGAVAWGVADDVEQRTSKSLSLPASRARQSEKKRTAQEGRLNPAYRLLVGKSVREEAEDETVLIDEDEAPDELTSPPTEETEEEAAFAHAEATTDAPGVPRLTMEQIVAHTQPNSYEVYIGRSLTRPNFPAIKINFYKRHLKLIGASQHGKSSMAAAILEAILRTHDVHHVRVTLLDLEDKTSRLFANAPHVLRLRVDDDVVRFHARSYEEVLQHLEYLSSVIDSRYRLSDEELDQQPIIIVYLEEFIDLKDYFKQRIEAVEREKRDQAKQDYARLVYYIKKIAARGLKVLVQLLMCAQVDYRDDDLQAALINVTSGMSFCVRVSAAQAAGFYQTELLQRNAREDKVGQAVVEMPDCKDLVLAPEYNLKTRLAVLARAHRSQELEEDATFTRRPLRSPVEPTQRPVFERNSVEAGQEDTTEAGREDNVIPFAKTEVNEPVDSTQRASGERKKYLMTSEEIDKFLPAYRACGNIDKALVAIGKGTHYREHARRVLQVYGFREEA